MRLLQAGDLMNYYNEGHGQCVATVVISDPEYHGKIYPIECTVSQVVEVVEIEEKTVVDKTNPAIPQIKIEKMPVVHYAAKPLGVCWPSDIERVLKKAATNGDTASTNPNLRTFTQGLVRVQEFKKEIAAYEELDKKRNNPFALVHS